MRQTARTPLTPRDRLRLTERASPELGAPGPAAFRFTPQRHGLSPELCRVANQRFRMLERTRPIREGGARGNARRALRIGGIVSSVRGGRIGASGWGRRMLATKGGNVMRDHALHHLRTISPIGLLAARMAKERREAQTYWETHGEPLPLGVSPTETPEQRRQRELTDIWEAAQWQSQHGRFSW